MEEVISALGMRLQDVSYVLHVFGKQFSLLLENSNDENANIILENGINEIKSVKNSIDNLLDSINENRDSIIEQWGEDKEFAESLKHEVDKLENAAMTFVNGNKELMSKICAE